MRAMPTASEAIANIPEYNSLFLVIYYCPNPEFIAFVSHKCL
jgi:hypothetical protein